MVKIQNLTIGYKNPLINNINTDLSVGDMVMVVGDNGVGKTTLFKNILNQIKPLSGNILLNKKSVTEMTSVEISKQISMVFSKANIPKQYTTLDLVSLGKLVHYPYYFRLNNIDKHEINTIISHLNLDNLADRKLIELSDGNLQKAFIGRALAQDSTVIILDEPTAHLDEANKIAILKILRSLAKENNKIILFSSHDWRLAKEFSDKIWYIKDHKLFSGITEDILLQHPELMKPSLFDITSGFVAPQIVAPEIQKELLFSFLQKNFEKDLSKFQFIFKESFWHVSINNFQSKLFSFEEILQFLSKN